MRKSVLAAVAAACLAAPLPSQTQFLPESPIAPLGCEAQCAASFAAALDLVSKLSDDIGSMADRIGSMADRIGEFGDRILVTEELLANLAVQLAELGATGGTTGGATGVVLLTPFGTVVDDPQLPPIETATPLGQYLLFASPEVVMGRDAVSVLIRDQADLAAQWPVLREVSKDGQTLYVAIKAIDGNRVSDLSNTVLLHLR